MDGDRFDTITKMLVSTLPRRAVIRLVAGGVLGAIAAALGFAGAGATHYGCRHVGKPCRRDGQCCSGRCRRNVCRAHHQGGCALADNFCAGGEDNRCDPTCTCNITTGNAPFCGGSAFCPAVECQRDVDCGEPGAACIPPVNCQGCGNPATQNFCQRPCFS